MKSSLDPTPETPATNSMLQKGERTKLIAMSILLAVVLIAFFTSQSQKSRHEDVQQGQIESEPEFNETITVRPFADKDEAIAQILDNRREDRVLLPSRVLDPFVDYVKGFSDAQFNVLGPKELDAAAFAALESDPSAHRAEPYRVRGRVGDLRSQLRQDGVTEYRGWLVLADESIAHFVVTEVSTLDHYMRLDGLFVKLYRGQSETGEWKEGPLFVGAQAVRSYPASGPHDAEALEASLVKVKDDSMSDVTGLNGAAFDAKWDLVAYARSEEAARIDWDSEEVFELDNLTMAELLKDAATPEGASKYRGKPFRIPISKNMGIWTESPGETPSRIDELTTGWIGNWTWSNRAGVIKFIMPELRSEMHESELISGKGFFLKVFSYEPRDGGIRQAPFFVITELEEFHPVESHTAQYLMWGVVIITLLLVALFPILLFRDRKKSEALQRDLVRRKQERRRRLATQQPQA